ALANHLRPTFSDPLEEIVYSVSRELLETTGVSATTYAQALAALGPEPLPGATTLSRWSRPSDQRDERNELCAARLIELVALVGYGCMLSLAVNTFEPDLFPDDRALLPGGPPPTTYARSTGGPRLSPLQDAALSDAQRRLATQLEAGSPGSVQGAYAL